LYKELFKRLKKEPKPIPLWTEILKAGLFRINSTMGRVKEGVFA
jgi:hypothetical protein